MSEPKERHYNIKSLNKWFAFSSGLFLIVFIGIFAEDYAREWKRYQRTFRKMESARVLKSYEEEKTRLDQQERFQEVQASIQEAVDEFKGREKEIQAAERQLRELQTENYRKNQLYQFSKAELDSLTYRLEVAQVQGSDGSRTLDEEQEELKARTRELKLDAESSDESVALQEQAVAVFTEKRDGLEKRRKALARERDLLQRQLSKISPEYMTVWNRMADGVRDLPVLDALAPSLKVDQFVVKGITEDVVFARVPKVDRCTSCHTGILKPGYEDAPQPYRTHPRLDFYLSSKSPHPVEEFGCTSCHNGRGRGTDFVSAVHMPSSPEQQEEWEKKYHWHKLHHWEKPMLPLKHIQAGCFQCHGREASIKGADQLNLGLQLIEKSGCYGCHQIEKYKDRSKPGPNLTHLSAKVTKDWAYRWISDPHSFRPDTWMPSFFRQSNTKDAESVSRAQQEIHAIVAALFGDDQAFPIEQVPLKGDPKSGEELVASIGCMGCHQTLPRAKGLSTTPDQLRREHGPVLTGLGSKTTEPWIYQWLKNPHRYHPHTRMPSLRLTNQEAADIASFLILDRNTSFENVPIPGVNEEIVNEIVFDLFSTVHPEATAKKKVAAMDLPEKLSFAGQKLVRHYGCFGCHEIPGFEKDKPIGTELTEAGSKSVHKLDFGFSEIDHLNYSWFSHKLQDPRLFDHGKRKQPLEKLRMPNFNFSEKEIDAIVTALLGFVATDPKNKKIKEGTARNLFIEQGQALVREYNCQGCHAMEGEGGTIQESIGRWLVRFKGKKRRRSSCPYGEL